MDKLKNLWAKVKQHKKQAAIGAAAVAAILIGLLVYNHNHAGYTVDISQLYEFNYSGFSGKAKPSMKIASQTDEESLIANIFLKLYPNASSDFIKYSQYEEFFNKMKFDFNKEDNISNGDEITATASYDKTQAKLLKLNLKNTTLKTTASNLYELIDGNTPITDNLKEVLESKFEEKSSYLFDKYRSSDLDKAFAPIITDTYDLNELINYSDRKFNVNEKYVLKPKDNKSDPAEFVYLYDLNFNYHNSVGDSFSWEKSFVGALILSDVYHSKSDEHLMSTNYNNLEFTLTIYNNLDEAKQKILDQDKYDIEQL